MGMRNYTCSTYNMTTIFQRWKAENPGGLDENFNGWCATDVDDKKRIKEMGLCQDKAKCKSQSHAITFATINLLTKDECEYLLQANSTEKGYDIVPDYEMCGGKKNLFPAKRPVFAREQKTRKEVRTDVRLRKRIMKVEG